MEMLFWRSVDVVNRVQRGCSSRREVGMLLAGGSVDVVNGIKWGRREQDEVVT